MYLLLVHDALLPTSSILQTQAASQRLAKNEQDRSKCNDGGEDDELRDSESETGSDDSCSDTGSEKDSRGTENDCRGDGRGHVGTKSVTSGSNDWQPASTADRQSAAVRNIRKRPRKGNSSAKRRLKRGTTSTSSISSLEQEAQAGRERARSSLHLSSHRDRQGRDNSSGRMESTGLKPDYLLRQEAARKSRLEKTWHQHPAPSGATVGAASGRVLPQKKALPPQSAAVHALGVAPHDPRAHI